MPSVSADTSKAISRQQKIFGIGLLFCKRVAEVVTILTGIRFNVFVKEPDGEEPDQGAFRERRVFLAAVSAGFGKLVTVATLLISVPLTLGYLGADRYGLWVTMSSAAYFLSFADLGVGNALLTVVAEAYGRNDYCAIRRASSTAMLIFLALGLAILAIFSLLYPFVNWGTVFNVQSPAGRAEVGPGLFVLVFSFALSLPLSVAARLQGALQEGYRANLWAAFGSLIALAATWLVIRCEAGLPWLALGFSGAPVAVAFLNGLVFFWGPGAQYVPNLGFVSLPLGKRLFQQGVSFLGIQIIVAINVASDTFIISRMLGPEMVTAFSVPERMFGLIPMLIHLALQPLWPAYAEALSRQDLHWVKRTLRRSFLIAFAVSTTFCMVLVLTGGWIVQIWTGGAVIAPTLALLLGLALWKVVDAVEFALTMFLNSSGELRPVLIFGSVATALSLILKILFVKELGIAGVPWVSGAVRLTTSLIPLSLFIRSRKGI